MYAKLTERYVLRGWKSIPYALIDTKTADIKFLTHEAYMLFDCLDGETNLDVVLMTPMQRELLARLLEEGTVERHEKPIPLLPYQRYKKSGGAYVKSLHWSITGMCHLKCRHCYMGAPGRRYSDMSTEECLTVIRQMQDANISEVSVTGGEPLLRKDFWRLIDAFTEAHIHLSQLYTNGLLIDSAFLENMRRRGLSFAFVLSFDCAGCHDWMRGISGTEEKTVAIINRLCAEGHIVSVETALHSGNINQLLPTYELLKKIGVHFWKTSLTYESGEWRKNKVSQLALEDLYTNYFLLCKKYLADGQPFNIQLDGFFAGRKGGGGEIPYVRSNATPEGLKSHSCLSCRTHPYLLPDGRLIPCPSMTDTFLERDMPNMLSTTIAEVYGDFDGKFFRLANIRAEDVVYGNQCASCEYRFECGGGCRACAIFSGNGEMGYDKTVCRYFKEGYRDRVGELIAAAEY
ncbi:MAG: radical SAM protein [Clostridiales bacterium]|nr:radical SAM protein [Clostridiales bacterium]